MRVLSAENRKTKTPHGYKRFRLKFQRAAKPPGAFPAAPRRKIPPVPLSSIVLPEKLFEKIYILVLTHIKIMIYLCQKQRLNGLPPLVYRRFQGSFVIGLIRRVRTVPGHFGRAGEPIRKQRFSTIEPQYQFTHITKGFLT